MVCVRVVFHENDGNHDENDEDNSDSYKQGVECWIRGNHGNHENDENHGNPGCKPRVPQTTDLEIPNLVELLTHSTLLEGTTECQERFASLGKRVLVALVTSTAEAGWPRQHMSHANNTQLECSECTKIAHRRSLASFHIRLGYCMEFQEWGPFSFI